MKLRPYQQTAVESALRAVTTSGSAVLQLPTAAGKTRTATEIVRQENGVVWFVCHRQEIINQTAKAFAAAGLDFGVVPPRHDFKPDKRIQIVSVGTLRGKMGDMPAPALVIWDECHHVAAKSWAAIRESLTGARHLGLTATPERLDGKGLAEWFAELIVGPSIEDLVGQGYLSQFRYFAPSEPDLTQAKLVAGDYKKKDAAAIMRTPVIIGDAIREYKDKMNGKRAIVFAASVEASQEIAARFNEEGIAAAHVDGTTRDDVRAKAVEDLRTGAVKVLCNVEVFTEGFDVPKLDGVILMRPTKSPTLLLQMIGRALRKDDEKQEAIILDHAGLYQEHDWFARDWKWSLHGHATRGRGGSNSLGVRKCPSCSEVYGERVEVCRCGFVFASGREIGEYDGRLREIRGTGRPEGSMITYDFLKMLRISMSSRCHLSEVRKYGKYVMVKEELAHLKAANYPFLPPLFSSRREQYVSEYQFKELFKITPELLEKITGREVRRHANGWLDKQHAEELVRIAKASHMHLGDFNALLGQHRVRKYRAGSMSEKTLPVLRQIYRGRPSNGVPWVNTKEALAWILANRPDIKIPPEAWLACNDNGATTKAA